MHARARWKIGAGMVALSLAVGGAMPEAVAAPRATRRPTTAPAREGARPRSPRLGFARPATRWNTKTVSKPLAKAGPNVPTRADRVRIVLATARSLLGTPYRYGGTTPAGFDCSGFTGYVWRKAGVSLPRTSGAQYGSLPKVPRDQMQPGDLVYSPGHIGLYIGGGQMIHSPHSGAVVEVSPLHDNVAGAVRPG